MIKMLQAKVDKDDFSYECFQIEVSQKKIRFSAAISAINGKLQ